MDNIGILNLLVAIARALDIDPEELAEAFNQRNENQKFYDALLRWQAIGDRNPVH